MPVTAVRDEGALRMWVCRLPVHIGPLGSCEFAGDFIKISASCGRTESSSRRITEALKFRRRGRRLCRPEKCNEFAGNSRKNGASQAAFFTPVGRLRFYTRSLPLPPAVNSIDIRNGSLKGMMTARSIWFSRMICTYCRRSAYIHTSSASGLAVCTASGRI